MTKRDHIAAGRSCGTAGGAFGKICLVYSLQEATLLLQTFQCSGVELFFKLHTPLYGHSGSISRPFNFSSNSHLNERNESVTHLLDEYSSLTMAVDAPNIAIE